MKNWKGQGCFVANKNVELIREEQFRKVENLLNEAVNVAKISKIKKEEVNHMLDILFEEE